MLSCSLWDCVCTIILCTCIHASLPLTCMHTLNCSCKCTRRLRFLSHNTCMHMILYMQLLVLCLFRNGSCWRQLLNNRGCSGGGQSYLQQHQTVYQIPHLIKYRRSCLVRENIQHVHVHAYMYVCDKLHTRMHFCDVHSTYDLSNNHLLSLWIVEWVL